MFCFYKKCTVTKLVVILDLLAAGQIVEALSILSSVSIHCCLKRIRLNFLVHQLYQDLCYFTSLFSKIIWLIQCRRSFLNLFHTLVASIKLNLSLSVKMYILSRLLPDKQCMYSNLRTIPHSWHFFEQFLKDYWTVKFYGNFSQEIRKISKRPFKTMLTMIKTMCFLYSLSGSYIISKDNEVKKSIHKTNVKTYEISKSNIK